MFYIFSGSQFSWLSFVSYNTISSRDNKISFWLPPLRVLAFVTFPTCLWSLHTLRCLHTSGAYILSGSRLPASGVHLPLEPTCLRSPHTLRSLHTLRSPHVSGSRLPLEPTYSQEPTYLRCLLASEAYILSGAYMSQGVACLPLVPTYSQEPTCLRSRQYASGAHMSQGAAYLPLEPTYLWSRSITVLHPAVP